MVLKSLIIATLIGLILQLVMVMAGHINSFVRLHVFAIGGCLLSLIAGVIYARMAPGGWGDVLIGGAIAGGVCAFLGIAISVALKDVPPSILLVGTLGSTAAGVIGAAIARGAG